MSTKDTVLALFERNKGFFVSGERIAEELNISRTAVWKAVKKLQQEGYEIKAITNRGYCLDKESDVLTQRGIISCLNEDNRFGLRPEVFVRVDSTNTVCVEKAAVGEDEGYVAIAGSQSAGRGRRGRAFFSPAETGIYMSILLKPSQLEAPQVLRVTTMAAAAVCEAIEAVTHKRADIKWVNDIYMKDRKVCGILTEAAFSNSVQDPDYVIVGIGINAYTPKDGFPEAIADIAGSIFDYCSPGLKNRLVAEILDRFMAYYKGVSANDYIEEYRKRSIAIGKDVTVSVKGKAVSAHVLGIDDECGLMVRYDDGTEATLRSGEVSIKL